MAVACGGGWRVELIHSGVDAAVFEKQSTSVLYTSEDGCKLKELTLYSFPSTLHHRYSNETCSKYLNVHH